MSETSPTEPAPEPTEPATEPTEPASERTEPAQKPSATAPSPAPGRARLTRWLAFAGPAIALIAVGIAVVAWFRPLSPGSAAHTFSDQQIQDAKIKVCNAFTSVRQAVVNNTNLTNPAAGDRIGALAVTANARLALYGGGGYLRDRLALEPATPADLAKAVNTMATTLEDLAIGYMAGAPDFTEDPLRRDVDSEIEQIDKLCR